MFLYRLYYGDAIWLQVITIKIFFKVIVSLLCVVFSIHKSKRFLRLIEEFEGFDSYTLQVSCPSDFKMQTFYLLYAISIEMYYIVIEVYYSVLNVPILTMWTLVSLVTMLMIIQYVIFVRILRERYKWANYTFARSKWCTSNFNFFTVTNQHDFRF